MYVGPFVLMWVCTFVQARLCLRACMCVCVLVSVFMLACVGVCEHACKRMFVWLSVDVFMCTCVRA